MIKAFSIITARYIISADKEQTDANFPLEAENIKKVLSAITKIDRLLIFCTPQFI